MSIIAQGINCISDLTLHLQNGMGRVLNVIGGKCGGGICPLRDICACPWSVPPYLVFACVSCLSKLLEFFKIPFAGFFCNLSAMFNHLSKSANDKHWGTKNNYTTMATVTNCYQSPPTVSDGISCFFLLKLVTHWKFHFEALVGNFTGHVSKCDTCQGRIFFVSITMGNEYNKQICDSYEMGTKSVDVVFLLKISHPNRV